MKLFTCSEQQKLIGDSGDATQTSMNELDFYIAATCF